MHIQLPLFSCLPHHIYCDPLLAHLPDSVVSELSSGTSLRRAVFSVETVFSVLRLAPDHPRRQNRDRPTSVSGSAKCEYWNVDGIITTASPKRLATFQNSLRCRGCGREGHLFTSEVQANNSQTHHPSLNLYCVEGDNLILMTVDHILPHSLGGRYDPSNFQTMCQPCNGAKQNLMTADEIARVRRNMRGHAKQWVNRAYLNVIMDLQLQISSTVNPSHKQALMLLCEQYRRKSHYHADKGVYIRLIHQLTHAIDDVNVLYGIRQPSMGERVVRWVDAFINDIVRTLPFDRTAIVVS